MDYYKLKNIQKNMCEDLAEAFDDLDNLENYESFTGEYPSEFLRDLAAN